MGKKAPLLEVDPLCLPLGMRIGPWRIRGWRGRGAYGTVYRVEQEYRKSPGSFALKLAIYPRDERFEREALLLSRIDSLHVPQFHAQGEWEHPSGTFPYLVMEWVEGESLYEWAARQNPSSRQALRLLAQVESALVATHEAGGVHRDVKGSNVLVRAADCRAFLTDFGAGYFRGASTLTSKLLPPGTLAYRSPEAQAFLRMFLRHPTAHYPASACDDLFALGVMAYRLVTDEYPPPTDESGIEVWREGGPGPIPPRKLNPQVSPKLEDIILRLLAIAPIDRFQGRARQAAEALEQAAASTGTKMDESLFRCGHEHHPLWRSAGDVRLAAEQAAAARTASAQSRAIASVKQTWFSAFDFGWAVGSAVAFLGMVLVLLAVKWQRGEQVVVQAAGRMDSSDGGHVAVGDSTMRTPVATLVPDPESDRTPVLGMPLPEKLFPGQRRPPCVPRLETAIRGACWVGVIDMKPPCGNNAFDWEGKCYIPSFNAPRQPTSNPPD